MPIATRLSTAPATVKGIDTINRALTGAQILAARYAFVCRYVLNAPGNGSLDKELTAAEAKEKTAAGIRIVNNFEWAAVPKNTVAEGKAHANAYLDRQKDIGWPDWAPCYYSVDTGAGAGGFHAYATGWADVLDPLRCGVYGDGALYRALKKAGLITLAWQSMSTSFPGNSDTTGADIIQHSSGSLAGHSCDFNTAESDYYGGWLLGEEDPMAITQTDANLFVATLLNSTNAPKLVNAIFNTDKQVPNYPWMADASTNSTIKPISAIQDGGNEAHNANLNATAAAAGVAGVAKQLTALTALVQAGGGSTETAAILKAIGDAESATVAAQAAQIAALTAKLAAAEQAAAAALTAK